MIFYFKNSFLASVCSVLGSILVIFSIAQLVDEMIELPLALLLIAAGVALYLLGRTDRINELFKTVMEDPHGL